MKTVQVSQRAQVSHENSDWYQNMLTSPSGHAVLAQAIPLAVNLEKNNCWCGSRGIELVSETLNLQVKTLSFTRTKFNPIS